MAVSGKEVNGSRCLSRCQGQEEISLGPLCFCNEHLWWFIVNAGQVISMLLGLAWELESLYYYRCKKYQGTYGNGDIFKNLIYIGVILFLQSKQISFII